MVKASVLFAALLLASSAFAQSGVSPKKKMRNQQRYQTVTESEATEGMSMTSAPVRKNTWDSSRGFRIGYVRPSFDFKAKATANGYSNTGSQKIDDTNGVLLGYVSIPAFGLGWAVDGVYYEATASGVKRQIARLDGNLAFGLSKYFHLKGGINTSKFMGDAGGLEKMDPFIGGQIGVGVQITPNIGLDVSYVEISQRGKLETMSMVSQTTDIETKLTGVEVGVHGTF